MLRDCAKLTDREFDLVIVGGGIFGICCAREAAAAGLTVALLERGDFAQAASANHFKMAHGGIRYLQHLDFRRVRASCRERSALLRIAPHLVRPLPILIPNYGHGMRGKGLLRAAFLLYSWLTFDRNRGIGEAGRIPAGTGRSAEEALELFPGLTRKGLTGGAVFWDGQIRNPARLAVCFLRSASASGAQASNYSEVSGLLRFKDRVVGVAARDLLTGELFEVRGKVVVNAAGPWADELNEHSLGVSRGPKSTFSRDVALIVDKAWDHGYALASPSRTRDAEAMISRGGRHLFFAPWRRRTLIGVWHGVHQGSKDRFSVTEGELCEFIQDANQSYPGLHLALEDVRLVYAGLTLFGGAKQDPTAHEFGKRSLLIDHARQHGVEGLVTLIGVRATMARGMAESAVRILMRKLGRASRPSETAFRPIFGGEAAGLNGLVEEVSKSLPAEANAEVAENLAHNYGSEYRRVLGYLKEDRRLGETLGESSVLKAEVVHAVREEMAQRLCDVALRRTDLATAGDPGEAALQECAGIMSEELSWDAQRTSQELGEMKAFLEARGRVLDFGAFQGQDSHPRTPRLSQPAPPA